MINPLVSRTAAALCGIFMLAAVLDMTAGAARAADASAWDADGYSSLRLLGGSKTLGEAAHPAGIELALKPGWKTYWRYPGDSGVPPEFDFSASDNVAGVTVGWPAPKAFPDGAGGHAIGYKGDVIFPLSVTAKDANAPVVLRVTSHYAVCEKLCVPATGKAELALPEGASQSDAALADARAHVPRRAGPGDATPLAVHAIHIEKSAGKPRISVDINAGPDDKVALFVEGPTARWALPLPEATPGAPQGRQRFVFLLDGVPKDAQTEGAVLRFTAVGDRDAVETQAPLN